MELFIYEVLESWNPITTYEDADLTKDTHVQVSEETYTFVNELPSVVFMVPKTA